MPGQYTSLDIFVVEVEKPKYEAQIRDEKGQPVARHPFEFRFDLLTTHEQLRRLDEESVARGSRAEIVAHGQKVGFDLCRNLLGGEVGQALKKARQRAESAGQGLRLRLRIEPKEMMSLPWELLYDEEEGCFLLPATDILLSRLPHGIPEISEMLPITPPIHILVVVSNPLDLPEDQQLDTQREEEVILEALDALIRSGQVEVDFLEEASLDEIQQYFIDKSYHILHYTGHGAFNELTGEGYLIMEDEEGNATPVSSEQIATLLGGRRSLRLVVLSGCLTARERFSTEREAYSFTTELPAAAEGRYTGMARLLLRRGVPATLAMQYSIADQAAIKLARTFYETLAANQPLDVAVAEARQTLYLQSKDWGLAWATPTLFLRGREGWALGVNVQEAPKMELEMPALTSLGGLELMERGFVGRRREIRAIKKGFLRYGARLALVHGFGGIGKTVLATKVAEKLKSHFDGVLGLRVRQDLASEQLLQAFNEFFKLHGLTQFEQVMASDAPLEMKAQLLGQFLRELRLLVILDNCEDWLDESRSRIANEELLKVLRQLVNTVDRNSKFILTSRYDFELLQPGRGGTAIRKVSLGELSRIEAIRLMNRLPSLARAQWGTKQTVYHRLGGHPFTINLFAQLADELGAENALPRTEEISKEAMDEFLLGWIYDQLTDDGQRLLRRMGVLRQAAPLGALEALLAGDHRATASGISDLMRWGLLVKTEIEDMLSDEAEERYGTHALVREYAVEKLDGERQDALLAAAGWYEKHIKGLRYRNVVVFNLLESRHYYFRAGEYEKAGEIISGVMDPLLRWGFLNLVEELNRETMDTARGKVKCAALHNLGVIMQHRGDYPQAVQLYEQSLKMADELGDKSGIAISFHQLGMIHQNQGNYPQAMQMYQQSLKIKQELGDKKGIASSLHNLGAIHQAQGNYPQALQMYERSLEIREELGDRSDIAVTLHQLGMIHHDQGNYPQAVQMYERSLKISEELHDKGAIAITVHQLGMIHHAQGNYLQAVELYDKSLKTAEELGDKSGIGVTLHQLGNVHYLQGNYPQAVQLYEKSLKIAEELGEKSGIAINLHQLGMIHQAQGNYPQAVRMYEGSLKIEQELGNKLGIAQSLHQLGMIHQAQGNYPQAVQLYEKSLKIEDELGDKRGVASTLHQLGMIYQAQGNHPQAVQMYERSLEIGEELADRSGIASALHQLGMIYQAHGNYSQAARMYEQSLKISEALGDKEGIAISLSQLGRMHQEQGEYREAIGKYLPALASFEELRSPHAQTVARWLCAIRDEIGDQTFRQWGEELLADYWGSELQFEDVLDILKTVETKRQEGLVALARIATRVVRYGSEEEQTQWEGRLSEMQKEIPPGEAEELRQFLAVLRGTLRGEDVSEMASGLVSPFREIFERMMKE